MLDFEKERRRMAKQHRIAKVLVGVWSVIVAAMVVYGMWIVGDLLTNPEKIGQFAGKVAAGYEEAQR